ncbi:MAG TPA: APC family permease [Rhizomicrobium sp.]|nr:APC family permease [Rhizomicrobium sp.]
MKVESGQLLRSVGLWGLAAMVFNGMVGAGIFAMPGSVTAGVGVWAPLVVLGVGLALLPVVMGMCILSRMFDRTGGPIAYVSEAFGPIAGFQTGWLASLSSCAVLAANANLFADYSLSPAPPRFLTPLVHAAIALAALAVALAVNLCSARRSAGVLRLIALGKAAPLLWLLALAVPAIVNPAAAAQLSQGWSPAQAVLLAAYAFIGFEGALTPAGEARNPERDLPRAMLGVFIVVVLLYAALTWGFVVVAYNPMKVTNAPLALMGELLAGKTGLAVILVCAALSILGNLISTALFVSRRLVALEELGSLPRWFGWVDPANGVPRNAVLFTAVVVVGLTLSGGFKALALLSVASRLLIYLASLSSLPIIRARRGLPRFASSDLFVVLGIPVCVIMLSQTQLAAWLSLGAAALTGLLIMLIARQARVALAV